MLFGLLIFCRVFEKLLDDASICSNLHVSTIYVLFCIMSLPVLLLCWKKVANVLAVLAYIFADTSDVHA